MTGKSGEEFHGWRKVPGWEKEGLVIVINVDDKLESLRETPAQLEASQAPHCVKCGHVTQRAASGPAGPQHTRLHFHFYEYFLNSQGISIRYCVLESEVPLSRVYNFFLRKQVRKPTRLDGPGL